jgi:hypothetical protein
VAAAARAHARKDGLGQVDEAEHVGLEHGADLVVLTLLYRGQVAVAGIVDEDVNPAKAALCLANRIGDVRWPGHVQRGGQDGRIAGKFIQAGRISGRGDDAVTVPHDRPHQFLTKAGRAAGDKPDGSILGHDRHPSERRWHAQQG